MTALARFGVVVLIVFVGAMSANAQPIVPTIPQGDTAVALLDDVRVVQPGVFRATGRYAVKAGTVLTNIKVYIDYFDPRGNSVGGSGPWRVIS